MKLTDDQIARVAALEHQGRCTAQTVLDDARDPASPLHELFDWNAERAANQHWLDRSRQIIRACRIVVHTSTQTVKLPRYVRDPEAEPRTQSYVTLDSLRLDAASSRRALRAEVERVASALKRARGLAIGLGLEDDIDRLLAAVAGLRSVVDDQGTDTVAPPADGADAVM